MSYLDKGLRDSQHHIWSGLAAVTNWECAVDGGAHVGVITDILRQKFKRVLAFEPGSLVLPMLRERAEAWSNVEVYDWALGDRHENVWFGNERNPAKAEGWHADSSRPGVVQMVKLDDTLLKSERVDLIKLDVEGGELAALQGALKVLRAWHPVVIAEVFQNHSQSVPINNYMAALGYRIGYQDYRDTVYIWKGLHKGWLIWRVNPKGHVVPCKVLYEMLPAPEPVQFLLDDDDWKLSLEQLGQKYPCPVGALALEKKE